MSKIRNGLGYFVDYYSRNRNQITLDTKMETETKKRPKKAFMSLIETKKNNRKGLGKGFRLHSQNNPLGP